MPVVKRKKHAEEEEEDEIYTQHEISGSEEGSEQEEEVLEEEEEEIQYEEDSPSYDEEELPSTSKSLREHAEESKRRQKRKSSEGKSTPAKKGKSSPTVKTGTIKKTTKTIKKGPPSKEKVITTKKSVVGSGDESKKTISIEYNDKNVDYNLYNEAPEHIKNLKIKISSNVVMLCRMIEATGNTSQGLTYDYAALSFVRQSKNGKAYEFNLPLNLAPCIVKGINLLIKNNPKFFETHSQDGSMTEHDWRLAELTALKSRIDYVCELAEKFNDSFDIRDQKQDVVVDEPSHHNNENEVLDDGNLIPYFSNN